jgi:peptidyl-dipeptidase Dcp
MTDYIPQSENVIPHIQVVCNFIKSDETFLSLGELTTLFHEFGHALHGMLSDCCLGSLSGTSVVWDFVELPSQIMENWCYEPEALNLFAKNEQGEHIPIDIIENIKKTQKYLTGLYNLRQVQLGLLDYYVHTDDCKFDPIKIEKDLQKTFNLWDDGKYYYNSQTFSHIFSGGYSMGYYSYKWSEVLECDAFNEFEKNGIFNKDVADRFKVLLSSGNTKPADELFRNFKGSDVNVVSFFDKNFK